MAAATTSAECPSSSIALITLASSRANQCAIEGAWPMCAASNTDNTLSLSGGGADEATALLSLVTMSASSRAIVATSATMLTLTGCTFVATSVGTLTSTMTAAFADARSTTLDCDALASALSI